MIDKLLSVLRKPTGAMSLGRVLIFLFGAEILVITPWVVFVGKENAPYVAFLVFFLVLFLSVIYSKIVDSKYLSFSVKDGDDKNEKH